MTATPQEEKLRKRLEIAEEDNADLHAEVAGLKMRLTIAASLNAFANEAYDALRYTGVDYRDCRVWKEPSNPLTDKVSKMTERQAANLITKWLERMTHDLRAAVKRKAIKEVPKG